MLTPAQAKEISRGRLILGNPDHIEAAQIMATVERAVKAMFRCHHNYELRTKLCSCLTPYSSEILVVATEDRRVGPQWKGQIEKCIKDRP